MRACARTPVVLCVHRSIPGHCARHCTCIVAARGGRRGTWSQCRRCVRLLQLRHISRCSRKRSRLNHTCPAVNHWQAPQHVLVQPRKDRHGLHFHAAAGRAVGGDGWDLRQRRPDKQQDRHAAAARADCLAGAHADNLRMPCCVAARAASLTRMPILYTGSCSAALPLTTDSPAALPLTVTAMVF